MTEEEFKTLLSDKPQSIRLDGQVLYNAVATTRKSYHEDESVPNLRKWEAAKAALDKFVAELGGGASDNMFDNLAVVLKYLQDNGWKAARNSLYRHQREGKILPDTTGKYTLRAVEKYAKTFLKQSATGKRVQENTDDLQRQKLEQELKNLRLKNEKDQFSYDKERGKYIPRERMEIEFAMRAGILDAGLKHWIQSKAAEWIRMVGGDTQHTSSLANAMTKDLNEHINEYASPIEFEVVIEAAENQQGDQP